MSIFKDLGFKKRNGKLVSPDSVLFDGKTYDEIKYEIKEDVILSGMVEDSDGLITINGSSLPATVNQDIDEPNWNVYQLTAEGFAEGKKPYVQFRAENGGTIYEDSGAPFTTNGASVSNTVYKYGTGSYYFPGGGTAIRITENEIFGIGTSDFTVECWYYPISKVGDYPRIIQFGTGWGSSTTLTIEDRHSGDTGFSVGINSSVGVLKSTSPAVNNQWVHIALSRQSGVMKLFINGVQEAQANWTNAINDGVSSFVHLGGAGFGTTGECINGYIDNFRFAKGVALYTENFTPADLEPNPYKKEIFVNNTLQKELSTETVSDNPFSLANPSLNTTVNVAPTKLNAVDMDFEFDVTMLSAASYMTLIAMNGDTGGVCFRLQVRTDTLSFAESIDGWTHTDFNFKFALGVTYHILAKLRGSKLEYFINGQSVGSAIISRFLTNTNTNLQIGHYNGADLWNGSIANLEIRDNVRESVLFEVEKCDTDTLTFDINGTVSLLKVNTWVAA